jgi:hypothetical protein
LKEGAACARQQQLAALLLTKIEQQLLLAGRATAQSLRIMLSNAPAMYPALSA